MQGSGPAYLIVFDDALVSMDMAETIREFCPRAEVMTEPTPESAARAIAGVGAIAQAFVAMSPEDFASSELRQTIEARGGAVVLLGDGAEDAPRPDWPVLHRPFLGDAILSHLRNPVRKPAA